jgi:2'-hydroxyisoflavone reductase
MKILILGGTAFVGRHLAEAAVARGHEVTLFNRGRRNPDLFPELERLRGERPDDLGALHGRRWDAAIDTSGYTPRAVAASAGLLAEAVDHYTFVSSLSVYADPLAPETDESGPVGTLAPEKQSTEEITDDTYGPLKVLAEQAAEAAMPGRVLVVRAGLIVGPHDPTDRFIYWPARVARGGEVLAPDGPDRPVQLIDARDLAKWMLDKLVAGDTGVFNATGPERRLITGELLESCHLVSGSEARFTWVDEKTLLEHNVGPWLELPLWLPREAEAIARVNNRKAIAAGLTFRPLAETVRDTLDWDKTRPLDAPRANGLSPEREAEVLAAWHAKQNST